MVHWCSVGLSSAGRSYPSPGIGRKLMLSSRINASPFTDRRAKPSCLVGSLASPTPHHRVLGSRDACRGFRRVARRTGEAWDCFLPSMMLLVAINLVLHQGSKMVARKVVDAILKGPSIIKEIAICSRRGSTGGLQQIHHWRNHRQTRTFCDLLGKGMISVVVRSALKHFLSSLAFSNGVRVNSEIQNMVYVDRLEFHCSIARNGFNLSKDSEIPCPNNPI
ncbi:hypothetical protein EJB05_34107 [Eragrostis curvula]|uniref:Uncharacterized protein n=1 Tax=Eragrostis curvula TaxID=38414 RepID=A0A5J9U4F6_9POAL|nr:hypothetical protein EJB05_34107 [Eragrostis curvula]